MKPIFELNALEMYSVAKLNFFEKQMSLPDAINVNTSNKYDKAMEL